MIDPQPHEIQALTLASMNGGAYVEEIGKTDLATWTEQEWMVLVDLIVTTYQDGLRQADGNDPPF